MTNKDITIVINTFKSEDKIFNCLNSIDSSYQIIIIENSNNNILKNQIEENHRFNLKVDTSKELKSMRSVQYVRSLIQVMEQKHRCLQ